MWIIDQFGNAYRSTALTRITWFELTKSVEYIVTGSTDDTNLLFEHKFKTLSEAKAYIADLVAKMKEAEEPKC